MSRGDQADRRAVAVRAVPERRGRVMREYGGMQRRLAEICAALGPAELTVVAEFLRRAADAGGEAVEEFLSE